MHIEQAVACDSRGRQEEIKKRKEKKKNIGLDVEELCAHTGFWVDVQLSTKSSHDSCDTQRGVEISEQSWWLYFINRESTVSLAGLTAAMWKDLERRERSVFG